MRVIGIDPGTGILGFGVIDILNPHGTKLVKAGVIRTPAKTPDAQRLKTIYKELMAIIKAHKPQTMVVERLFFARNVTTAMSVSQARGVVLLCGEQNGLDMYEYTPLQIKLTITGYGRADKKDVYSTVQRLLKTDEVIKPDDASDAVACAITHAIKTA